MFTFHPVSAIFWNALCSPQAKTIITVFFVCKYSNLIFSISIMDDYISTMVKETEYL